MSEETVATREALLEEDKLLRHRMRSYQAPTSIQKAKARLREIEVLLDVLAGEEARDAVEETAKKLEKLGAQHPNPMIRAAAAAKVLRRDGGVVLMDYRGAAAARPFLMKAASQVPNEFREAVLDAAADQVTHLLPHTILPAEEAVSGCWRTYQIQHEIAAVKAEIARDPDSELSIEMSRLLYRVDVDHPQTFRQVIRQTAEANLAERRAAQKQKNEEVKKRKREEEEAAYQELRSRVCSPPRADVRRLFYARNTAYFDEQWVSDGIVLLPLQRLPENARKRWELFRNDKGRVRRSGTCLAPFIPTKMGNPLQLLTYFRQEIRGEPTIIALLRGELGIYMADGYRTAWLLRQGWSLREPSSSYSYSYPLPISQNEEIIGVLVGICIGDPAVNRRLRRLAEEDYPNY